MFVLYDEKEQKIPIKVWLDHLDQLDESCLQQAKNLSNLPFAYKWIALMPDSHTGFGMPIGGVLATENIIIPNAVGVDIGCGMAFTQTNIPVEMVLKKETVNGKLIQSIIGDIMRNIPTGFAHHKTGQKCLSADIFIKNLASRRRSGIAINLMEELDAAHFQVGTLGSGNHFIELQTNEMGFLGIMVHSGSRNVGYKVCHFFNAKAKELNEKWKAPVPMEWDLAYLPVEGEEGEEYIEWMNFALDFAKENRERMQKTVLDIIIRDVKNHIGFADVEVLDQVSCHHNYAALENHFGKEVWVHRKGAIRAGEEDLGIIPGAMGEHSYLVKGKGNPESFHSCSHGAGRQMSRQQAKKQFSVEATMLDLKSQGVYVGKAKKSDIGEESRFAYKNIDFVIANEIDLVETYRKLKTIAVVKG